MNFEACAVFRVYFEACAAASGLGLLIQNRKPNLDFLAPFWCWPYCPDWGCGKRWLLWNSLMARDFHEHEHHVTLAFH